MHRPAPGGARAQGVARAAACIGLVRRWDGLEIKWNSPAGGRYGHQANCACVHRGQQDEKNHRVACEIPQSSICCNLLLHAPSCGMASGRHMRPGPRSCSLGACTPQARTLLLPALFQLSRPSPHRPVAQTASYTDTEYYRGSLHALG
jgi:hypothetical protein